METQITVWWADLTAADAALEMSLPAAERARLDGLTGADRARRAVGAALLHRAVTSQRAGSADGEVGVDRTCDQCGEQHGRPVVQGGPHVSVTHAGVLVVVATCETAAVGVDVERLSRFAEGTSDGEYLAAQAAQAAQAWVRREARLKAGVPESADGAVLALEPPLPGYAAALCVVTDSSTDDDVQVDVDVRGV